MRIISGSLRGRRYKVKDQPGVRPISGRIKQSVFDIIAGLVPGARVLDLFAGTGAVGIEALSRGAVSAFFIDLDKRCVEAISENLKRLGFAAKARAHPGDVCADLGWVAWRSGVSEFDLIYFGPPYKDSEGRPLFLSTRALARMADATLLAPRGVAMIQHHVKEDIDPPEGITRVRREKYGDSYVDFFRWTAAMPPKPAEPEEGAQG